MMPIMALALIWIDGKPRHARAISWRLQEAHAKT